MESGDTEYAGEGPYCRGRVSKRGGISLSGKNGLATLSRTPSSGGGEIKTDYYVPLYFFFFPVAVLLVEAALERTQRKPM